jgi:hypothetical protein
MNIIERPPVDPTNHDRSSENLEELLRAFYRAEMPRSWPELKVPVSAEAPRHAHKSWFSTAKSRLALAASIILLILSTLLLSQTLRDSKPASTQPNLNTNDSAHPGPGTTPAKLHSH